MTRRTRRLAVASLAVVAAVALSGCQRNAGQSPPAAASPTTAPATTAAPATTTAPTASTVGIVRRPRPLIDIHQGDRVWGVYWVSASLAQLSSVERQLRARGVATTSGDLGCDQGARERLGVADTITSRVAVYFRTEGDAQAFAEGVEVRPRPYGYARATLYCLD